MAPTFGFAYALIQRPCQCDVTIECNVQTCSLFFYKYLSLKTLKED
jgi:hypothetical protein